jgi:hypothetical protein
MLGFFFACYEVAKRVLAPPKMSVGLDGVTIVRHDWRHTFVPLENIRAARQTNVGSPVLLDLESDGVIEIGGSVVDTQKRDAFAQHVRDLLHLREASRAQSSEALARQGRTIRAWRDHLRGVVEGGGYRVAASGSTKELLEELVIAPGTPKEKRIGAALALRVAGDSQAIPLIRVAADACADNEARKALEAIAEEEVDEATLERVLAK